MGGGSQGGVAGRLGIGFHKNDTQCRLNHIRKTDGEKNGAPDAGGGSQGAIAGRLGVGLHKDHFRRQLPAPAHQNRLHHAAGPAPGGGIIQYHQLPIACGITRCLFLVTDGLRIRVNVNAAGAAPGGDPAPPAACHMLQKSGLCRCKLLPSVIHTARCPGQRHNHLVCDASSCSSVCGRAHGWEALEQSPHLSS